MMFWEFTAVLPTVLNNFTNGLQQFYQRFSPINSSFTNDFVILLIPYKGIKTGNGGFVPALFPYKDRNKNVFDLIEKDKTAPGKYSTAGSTTPPDFTKYNKIPHNPNIFRKYTEVKEK